MKDKTLEGEMYIPPESLEEILEHINNPKALFHGNVSYYEDTIKLLVGSTYMQQAWIKELIKERDWNNETLSTIFKACRKIRDGLEECDIANYPYYPGIKREDIR